MKVLYVILVTIASMASHSVYAQAEKSNTSVYAAKQDNPEDVEITAFENRIKVSNAPIGSKLEIYSVVGIKVKEIDMKQPSGEYIVNIAKGYYIIRVGNTVRKVAIR